MNNFRTVALVAGILSWGCSGQSASGSSPAPAPAPSPAPAALLTLGLAPTVIANTGYITAPNLVTTAMAGITAYVPTQAGASYFWTITGGTLTGIAQNAAAVFTAGPVGTLTAQCAVTLNGVVTTYSQDIPVVANYLATPFYYGSGFSADSLANTQVGGPNNNVVSYRFQSKHASALNSVRVFFIWSLAKSGYQAGLGGTVQVDLMADDGTSAHLPTGPVLATLSYGNIMSQGNYYPELPFPAPAVLKGGGLYHLVFTNTDPTPTANYVSLDTLYTNALTAPMQPCITDTNFAVLLRAGTGPWKRRNDFTPTLELEFADGGHQGNGYMEVWSTNPKTISGAASVRETFKVSGPTRNFTKVAVRLQRLAGTSPLTVRVEEADGSLVQQIEVPASSVLQGVSDWVTATFPLSSALATGVSYNLVFSSPADTQYSVYPMRKGTDKGFTAASIFIDGYAQFTTTGAAGWTGWDQWGALNRKDGDLQFMFVP